jgi:putative oxidoreductase
MHTSVEAYSFGILVLRVTLGSVLFAHGAQKVLKWFGGYGLQGTVGFFRTAYKIPSFFGYVGSIVEFLGSIGVFFGLFTRWSALGLMLVMSVAVFSAHRKNGFFMNWGAEADKQEGFEYTLTLALLALVLLVTVGGLYSLDAVI